jgi:predicted DNA binding protein
VRAGRSGEPRSVPDVAEHLRRDPWRRRALDRGFNAVLSVPIAYEEALYGVLSLYADESGAFPDRHRSALTELGSLVGYALTAVERKQALLSDRTVELEFEIRDERCPVVGLARRADCRLALRGTVPKSADRTLAFFAVPDGAVGAVEAAASSSVAVADVRDVGATDGDRVVRLEMERPFLATVLADHGAVLSELSVDAGTATAVVEFPSSLPPRTVTDAVTATAPDSTLVAKRTSARPTEVDRTDGSLRDELTERQAEALRAAHHHGYFDRPRRNDGTVVADSLGVSTQTFHQHRRAAIGHIVDAMFGDA